MLRADGRRAGRGALVTSVDTGLRLFGESARGEIFRRLHPDWQTDQDKAVRSVLADPAMQLWVAEAATGLVGFVAAKLDSVSLVGEIYMLAVDPAAQDQGMGTTLTQLATDWLRTSGMRVAMIDTGGDPGHAPARRVYEKAEYTLLPIARYFKAL